jgi:hypothetical protein
MEGGATMPRMKVEVEGDDGWTRWISPRPGIYRMACCDCGLVHDMQFKVVKVIKGNPEKEDWEYIELDPKKYRVIFRAKRNNRSTAALRRNKK